MIDTMNAQETLQYIASLIKSGEAWKGEWMRVAVQMIDQGYITPDGDVTVEGLSVVNLTRQEVKQ